MGDNLANGVDAPSVSPPSPSPWDRRPQYTIGINNGSGTNALAVLDARSGALLYSVPVSQPLVQITTTAAGPVATDSTDVLLLDGRTGRVRRTIPMRVPQSVVGAVGGHLLVTDYYVGPNGQHLSLIDLRTGQTVQTAVVGVNDGTQLAVDGRRGRVFAVGGHPQGSASVWMIDARTGAILHTETMVGSSAAIALDARAGRVFVAIGATDRTGAPIGPSGVMVVDARSGRVLHTIPLPLPPAALLVDAAAGHVVVVMSGGATQTSNAWGWIPPMLRHWLPFLPSSFPSTRVSPSRARLLNVAG